MTLTTCQICARVIKSKSGLIAHHGYQRPDHGWQTSSCMGARYRPYEVACDALPPAIESVERHIERMTATLVDWTANPPRAIRCERTNRRDAWDKYNVEWSVIRPTNFDPAAPVTRGNENQAPWDYTPAPRYNYGMRPCDVRSYAAVYAGNIKDFARDIADSKETLVYFRKRLAEWKAPAEAVTS